MNKVTIDATVWGYIKPVLVAGLTRGLGSLSAILAARGFPELPHDRAAAATVLTGIVAVGMWAWGPVRSWINHRLLAKAADPHDTTELALKQ